MSLNFLAIGHITWDRSPEGYRLGGTVSYAGVTAHRLGLRSAILTRGVLPGLGPGVTQTIVPGSGAPATEALAGIAIHVLPSDTSTRFQNLYGDGQRLQILEAVAPPIHRRDLPADLAEPAIVLLGPVASELDDGWAHAFPGALLGVTPQGWMRQWDAAGRVRPAPWANSDAFLERADAVILSREDVGGSDKAMSDLAGRARLLVVTDGWRGAFVYQNGRTHHIPPRPTQEVDPTGAGDVFAAAFLVRLREAGDAVEAARFANAVASFSVGATGMAGIPDRLQVNEWLRRDGAVPGSR